MVKKVKLISIDGLKGTAKVQIPGGQYREYPYVYSQLGVVPNSENVKEPMFELYLVGDDYDLLVVTLSYAGKLSTVNGNFGTVIQNIQNVPKGDETEEEKQAKRFDEFYKQMVKDYLKDVTLTELLLLLAASEILNGSAVVSNPLAIKTLTETGVNHDKTFLKLYYRFLLMLSIGQLSTRNVVTHFASTYHQENSEFVYSTNYPIRFLLLPTKPMMLLSQITIDSLKLGSIKNDENANTIEKEGSSIDSRYLQILAYATKAVISFKPVADLKNALPFNTKDSKIASIANMVDVFKYIQLVLLDMTKQRTTVNLDNTLSKLSRIYNFPYISVFAGLLLHYLRTVILGENKFIFNDNLGIINVLGIKIGSKGPMILNKSGLDNTLNIDIWNTIVDTYYTNVSDYTAHILSILPKGSLLYNMLIEMFLAGSKLTNSKVTINDLKMTSDDMNKTAVIKGKMLKMFLLFPGAWISTLQFLYFYNLAFLFKSQLFSDFKISSNFYMLLMLNTIYKYLEIQFVSSERVLLFCYLLLFVNAITKAGIPSMSSSFSTKVYNYVDMYSNDSTVKLLLKNMLLYRYNYNFLLDVTMNKYVDGFINESEKIVKLANKNTDYIDKTITDLLAQKYRQSIITLLTQFDKVFGFAHALDASKFLQKAITLENSYTTKIDYINGSNSSYRDNVILQLIWLESLTGAQSLNLKPGVFSEFASELINTVIANLYRDVSITNRTSDVSSIFNFVVNMQVDMLRVYTYILFLLYTLSVKDIAVYTGTFSDNQKLKDEQLHMRYASIMLLLDDISLATPTTYYPLSLSILYLQDKLGVKHTLQP